MRWRPRLACQIGAAAYLATVFTGWLTILLYDNPFRWWTQIGLTFLLLSGSAFLFVAGYALERSREE